MINCAFWLRHAVWKCKLIQNKGRIFWHQKSKSPRPRFLFVPPGLLLQIIWSKTILNYPSLIALPSITLDFKIPQDLLIIKSLISPDSEESILLSYLISICIMPPVSQSYTFEVKELEENSKSLFFPLFFSGGHSNNKRNTERQPRSHSELLMRAYWMEELALVLWFPIRGQPASLHIFICGDVCGWVGDYSGSAAPNGSLRHHEDSVDNEQPLWCVLQGRVKAEPGNSTETQASCQKPYRHSEIWTHILASAATFYHFCKGLKGLHSSSLSVIKEQEQLWP